MLTKALSLGESFSRYCFDGKSVKIAKQYEYSTASEAQNRAEREALSEDCAGADAYMVIEDPNSGEVGTPSFLIRLGNVPEFDDF